MDSQVGDQVHPGVGDDVGLVKALYGGGIPGGVAENALGYRTGGMVGGRAVDQHHFLQIHAVGNDGHRAGHIAALSGAGVDSTGDTLLQPQGDIAGHIPGHEAAQEYLAVQLGQGYIVIAGAAAGIGVADAAS